MLTVYRVCVCLWAHCWDCKHLRAKILSKMLSEWFLWFHIFVNSKNLEISEHLKFVLLQVILPLGDEEDRRAGKDPKGDSKRYPPRRKMHSRSDWGACLYTQGT